MEIPKLKRLWLASDSESNCDLIIQPLFNNKVICYAFLNKEAGEIDIGPIYEETKATRCSSR
ncbi:unnamed protein product [Camellia sinensis]